MIKKIWNAICKFFKFLRKCIKWLLKWCAKNLFSIIGNFIIFIVPLIAVYIMTKQQVEGIKLSVLGYILFIIIALIYYKSLRRRIKDNLIRYRSVNEATGQAKYVVRIVLFTVVDYAITAALIYGLYALTKIIADSGKKVEEVVYYRLLCYCVGSLFCISHTIFNIKFSNPIKEQVEKMERKK